MNRTTPGLEQPPTTLVSFWSMIRRPALIAIFCSSLIGSPPSLQAQDRIDPAPLLKTLQEDPDDRNALLQMGLYYTMEKNFGKAVEMYFRLLKVDPNNFHAYNNLGIIYKKVGQLKDSLHCYGQAMKLDPSNPWVPYNMGLAYESMGRMQEARESYGKALSLNPDFAQALQRLRDLSGSEQTAPLPPPTSILVADNSDASPRALTAGDLGKQPP
ncbi:MAG TPA: tetratricopeptide repeat protein, partial [Candidatus Ozemobacteraceae bacterium]|nr:tetratricopeptide repeat protein [Candidatus Ozemobacteraceae bacterium]